MADRYESLRLENQLCFPLYACSKEVVRRYKPVLDRFDLTYTQYLAMMALWEHKKINVKKLGELLYLDSGTLTPVLKKLEAKGLVSRTRSAEDERNLIITITRKGERLKEDALIVPQLLTQCVHLEPEEAKTLYDLLYKVMSTLTEPVIEKEEE